MLKMAFNKTVTGLAGAVFVLQLFVGAAAASNDVVDGESGVLNVSGELTQGACNIETESRLQVIDMGVISSSDLTYPGQQARSKVFHLHLRDCISSGLEEGGKQTGTVVRLEGQPEVRISFVSEKDLDDPQLIAVHGAKGFGLLLEDSLHQMIQPGVEGEPLALQTGNDDLIYWLTPERTREALLEGAWRSAVYMRFSYE